MEETQTLIITFLILSLTLTFLIGKFKQNLKLNLPPSPPFSLPIIAHLHLLKPPIQCFFIAVSQSLNNAPIFSLCLGNKLVFVVSSHSVAEECFTKNDVVLANRPNPIASKHVSYNYSTMVSSPYSEHWRNLQRIGAVEIFSNHRLNSFYSIRRDEIQWILVRLSHTSSLSLILAGTDTLAVTLEWALSSLLNNLDILKKARDEINNKIGLDRHVEESDISNLKYLQNIVSETFWLYPAGPLMVPHVASEDCKLAGYDMPRGVMLLVNVWAIHRDPKVWDGPASFKPERFEKEGETQKLMRFRLGRRACHGSGLAQRLVSFTLGSLIQCFEWERIGEEEVDMTEGGGITMPRARLLVAMCRARDFCW